MLVTVEGFGSVWSKRVRSDEDNPARLNIAYYNTTGITTNGRLRHRTQSFGQLRFNDVGGFNAKLMEGNLGRVFHCTGDLQAKYPKLIFQGLADGPAAPDYFLFTLTSDRTGGLPIGSYDWKSTGVLLVSLSQFRQQQEAIVLMPVDSWVRGGLGWFIAEPLPNLPWRAFLRLVAC